MNKRITTALAATMVCALTLGLAGCEGQVPQTVAPSVKDNEIIEGAKVMLTMPNGETVETLTDDFGDFYFRGIDEGTYGLAIEARGFVPVERTAIDVTESVNLGDFPLERA